MTDAQTYKLLGLHTPPPDWKVALTKGREVVVREKPTDAALTVGFRRF